MEVIDPIYMTLIHPRKYEVNQPDRLVDLPTCSSIHVHVCMRTLNTCCPIPSPFPHSSEDEEGEKNGSGAASHTDNCSASWPPSIPGTAAAAASFNRASHACDCCPCNRRSDPVDVMSPRMRNRSFISSPTPVSASSWSWPKRGTEAGTAAAAAWSLEPEAQEG